jgi:hypothetical protein
MDKTQKSKSQKNIIRQNVIESLKDIGSGAFDGLTSDVIRPKDFMDQLFGPQRFKKYSGEINPGEALEINEVYSGKRDEKLKLQKQIALERKLREEESLRFEKKSNELRIQLHALIEEIKLLAQTTQDLGQEVKVASMQAPIEPGVYHLIFFEKLLEFLKSFRKKIEDASIWLSANNKRAEKKNYWARYKKHGGKFLLSADHYLTRNAG